MHPFALRGRDDLAQGIPCKAPHRWRGSRQLTGVTDLTQDGAIEEYIYPCLPASSFFLSSTIYHPKIFQLNKIRHPYPSAQKLNNPRSKCSAGVWLNSPIRIWTKTDLAVSDEAQNAHQEVYGSGGYDNQAKFSHELIAGGAAFEGMKLFEDHQRKEGKKRYCPVVSVSD